MTTLYNAENKLLCGSCNQHEAKSNEEPWCIYCEENASGFIAALTALQKEKNELNKIWQFFFAKGLDCPELRNAVGSILSMEKKVQDHPLYKVEYASTYNTQITL